MVGKSIVFYTDSLLDEKIAGPVRAQISRSGLDVVSVSLKPLDFGHNIVFDGQRSALTMFRQILTGLEAATTDVIFQNEHDILYHGSHYDFTPPDPTKVYYNENWWQVRTSDGHCVHWQAKKVSQLCAYRELLIEHYRKRIELVEKNGFSMKMGYEPGANHRKERVDDLQSDTWWSEVPNIDIRHGRNLSKSKWSSSDFRDQRNCINWRESDGVPGWGKTEGRFEEFLADVIE